jgi:hypothetical protein
MGDTRKLVLPVALIAVMVAIAYVVLGFIAAIVFAVAFGGGLVLYTVTAWRTEFDTLKVIVPYLLTVMLFMIHTYEEYLTDFENTVSALAGRTVPEFELLSIVAWLAPLLWIAGAVMLIKRWAFGYYFLCAFFVAMTVAELSHYIFPFVIDGTFHYESGMYTAALPLITAYYGLYVMMQEIRGARGAAVV